MSIRWNLTQSRLGTNVCLISQDSDLRSKILNLPLTQDRRLAYTMDLSGKRSSEVMSH